MKKKTTLAKTAKDKSAPKPASRKDLGYGQLVTAISTINTQMVTRVATVANQALVLRNWMVGFYIVEFEQEGADRAKYGARLLETLGGDLKAKGIKGLGIRNLRDCRTFSVTYPEIRQAALAELAQSESDEDSACIGQAVLGQLRIAPHGMEILNAEARRLPTPLNPEQLSRICWAHFLELIRLDDPWKRAFYESRIRHRRHGSETLRLTLPHRPAQRGATQSIPRA